MLHLIRLRHGPHLANAVSEQFIHPRIRDPAERQRTQPEPQQGLARALDMMETHLEETLDIGTLADAANLSRRQLERHFQSHFRCSPQRYYLDLRLQRARAMLQYTDIQVTEIAIACGFSTAAHFSRSYRDWAGHAPISERQKPQGIVPIPR
jgi:transcriptional regulator GlxA family with amidase domain